MTESSTSLGAVFSFPGHGGDAGSHAQWRSFQRTLARELESVKTASMPDVASKIGELFDIQIPDILVSSWTKANEVRTVLQKSAAAPAETFWVGLGQHTVTSEHHPYVDIKIKGQTVRRIEFTLRLFFKLNSFVLKVQHGEIREIQTGSCDVQGVVEYRGITIAEKQLAPIQLPGVLFLQENN